MIRRYKRPVHLRVDTTDDVHLPVLNSNTNHNHAAPHTPKPNSDSHIKHNTHSAAPLFDISKTHSAAPPPIPRHSNQQSANARRACRVANTVQQHLIESSPILSPDSIATYIGMPMPPIPPQATEEDMLDRFQLFFNKFRHYRNAHPPRKSPHCPHIRRPNPFMTNSPCPFVPGRV